MNARFAWIIVPLVLPLAGCRRQEVAAKPPALVSVYTVAQQSAGEETLRRRGEEVPPELAICVMQALSPCQRCHPDHARLGLE